MVGGGSNLDEALWQQLLLLQEFISLTLTERTNQHEGIGEPLRRASNLIERACM